MFRSIAVLSAALVASASWAQDRPPAHEKSPTELVCEADRSTEIACARARAALRLKGFDACAADPACVEAKGKATRLFESKVVPPSLTPPIATKTTIYWIGDLAPTKEFAASVAAGVDMRYLPAWGGDAKKAIVVDSGGRRYTLGPDASADYVRSLIASQDCPNGRCPLKAGPF